MSKNRVSNVSEKSDENNLQAVLDPITSNSLFDFQPTAMATMFEYHDNSKFSRIEEEQDDEDEDELNDALIEPEEMHTQLEDTHQL